MEKETSGCTTTMPRHIHWSGYFCSWKRTATDNHAVSCDLRTTLATVRLKPSRSSRHSFAASMFAGDSSFGEDSMEMMEIIMVSTYDSSQLHFCNRQHCCKQQIHKSLIVDNPTHSHLHLLITIASRISMAKQCIPNGPAEPLKHQVTKEAC